MNIRWKRIQTTARDLMKRFGIDTPPIPVRTLACGCGARIVRVPGNNGNIDGFLYRKGSESVIGVNQDQAPVRQRFTIAHELGHLLLHEYHQVHVDRGFRVRLRNGVS